jgi:ABC-2 type transport system permease protein
VSAANSVQDRGYRRYEGPRRGSFLRMRALFAAALRRGLGVRRPWNAKIVPWTLLALALIPAAALVALRLGGALSDSRMYTPAGYLEGSAVILLPLAAAVAAELVCPERREHVLTLVFTRPVRRWEYLVAKLAALLVPLGLVTLAPLAALISSDALAAPDAGVWLRANADSPLRVVAACATVSTFYAALAFAVASAFARRGLATVAAVGLPLAGSILVQTLAEAKLGVGRWLALADPLSAPFRASEWMLGAPVRGEFEGPAYLAALALVTAAAITVWLRRLRDPAA